MLQRVCFVLLTFGPWTFHKVLVRVIFLEPKENRDPTGADFIPCPLCLPSHWVAVWLTYSEIPSSKVIAEHLNVSWLMRGMFFSRMSGAISADRAGPSPPTAFHPSYGSQKPYVRYFVRMNVFEQNNKLRNDRIPCFFPSCRCCRACIS